ncbi:MAG TPA: hypothetical protein VFB78_18945 [Acidimicrobiales bacterium]|nr:hypothetical protein [Acidimicrobiales bacterium]
MDEAPRRKRCSTCRQWKPLNDFNRRSTAKDGRQWSCRSCNSDYHRRNKARHNAQIHARTKREVRANTERLWAYLLGHPCVDCGEADPVVLEFDHLRDKRRNVAQLVRGWPWSTVLAEIAKCEVVCANCHRRRTYTRQGSWRVTRNQVRDTLF